MSLAEAPAAEVGVVPLEAELIAEGNLGFACLCAAPLVANYPGGETYGIGERILELFAMPLPDTASHQCRTMPIARTFAISAGVAIAATESGRSGRTIVRFNAFERFIHWMTATCFVILAISGLNITFGRPLLLPLIGEDAFSSWSLWAKYAHNYLSFPFTLGVIAIFLMWIAGNIPNRVDVEWLKRGGGMVGHDHPPAYRFNAGQKMIYWIVVIGGTAIAASGYVLMFPFYLSGIEGMQAAQMVHSIVALLFVAAMLAHIYIGTIGMEGAFEAMGEGTVDVNWAKEHHSLWLEEEMARTGPNESRRQPMATPAE
jgi:formate dehydrogenase subunit gamma